MVGPAVGGFLLAGTGIQGAFILSVLMYRTAIWAVLTIRSRIPRAVGSGAVLARIAEGLALVRTDKRLIGVLVVTVIYNYFENASAQLLRANQNPITEIRCFRLPEGSSRTLFAEARK
jgi:hypothetical protein